MSFSAQHPQNVASLVFVDRNPLHNRSRFAQDTTFTSDYDCNEPNRLAEESEDADMLGNQCGTAQAA